MGLWSRILQNLVLSLLSVVRLRIRVRECLIQYHDAANGSMLFVGITMAFVGMIGIYQTASQMARVLPEYSALGGAFIQFFVREMGPTMTGLLLATRVGTGIAAELGSMKVTDQIDAMKLSGVDPVEMLVTPRLISSTVACLSLATLGTVIAVIAGCAVAWFGFSVLPDTFLSFRFIRMPDLTMGMVKCLAFGVTVPLIACSCGFEAEGGSEGVGQATTRAVVWSSLAVIVLDALISFIMEIALK